ncbi:putative inactive ATP-dependent zinc metalloprotease FTSHI 2, chloroplastic [Trifolium repens]|nr:putative inactive ATP-dependent zinc metalloprotease FTSHI 2, chloroplastic [Trifolium repens]
MQQGHDGGAEQFYSRFRVQFRFRLSTIWAETADNARVAARMYMLGGLSEKYHGISNFWLSDRINEIDLEAMKVLNLCYERAKEVSSMLYSSMKDW